MYIRHQTKLGGYMSGDYFTSEHYQARMERDTLRNKVTELEEIITELRSKVKTHHTIFTNYELSFVKRRTSQ